MNKALEVYLSGNTKELDAALSKADKSLKDFGSKMESIGKTMSMAFTAPLVAMGAASIKMASDFNESMNKVDVAFKSSSKQVKEFAKTSLDSFGIAEGTALDMAALFGDMSTSMGLSTKEAAKLSTSLVGLAGDLSSFKNMNIGEVTTALNGIFTGETESLKRLGVVMTEVNLKTFALQKGFKTQYDQMSQAEKVMLRYQYIMDVTKNAQGDFARTQDGAANQMRKFQQGMEQLGASFGQVLLPAFTAVVSKINDVIKSFSNLDSGTKTTITWIAGLTALAGPLLYLAGTVIPKVITGINMLKTAIVTLGKSMKTAGLVGLITMVTAAAIEEQAALGGAEKSLTKLSQTEKTSVEAIKAKNKELYASILTYQELRAEAAKSDAAYKAQTNQERNTTKAYDDKIAAARAYIVANRELIKAASEAQNVDSGGGIAAPKVIDPKLAEKAKKAAAERLKTIRDEAEQARAEYESGRQNLLNLADQYNANQIQKNLTAQEIEIGNLNEWYDTQLNLAKKFGVDIQAITDEYNRRRGDLNKTFFEQELVDLQTYGAEAQATLDQQTADQLASKMEAMKVQEEQMKIKAEAISSAFAMMGSSLVSSFGLAKTGFEGFLSTMAQGLVQMGAMYLKQILMSETSATANAIDGASKSAAATGPAAIFTLPAFIALAVGAVSSAFARVPAFASGGIVSGPTMALMGEYPGAKSNPEVIAPLNKLEGMMGQSGGNNVNVTGEFIVRGQDLVLALNRAEKQYNKLT